MISYRYVQAVGAGRKGLVNIKMASRESLTGPRLWEKI